ncbi:hypothetical protein ACFE04_009240 [Oxalis oulophora]
MAHEEYLLDILKHLPAKTLTRFRCVSKSWNNLIRDLNFYAIHHHLNLSKPERTKLILIFKVDETDTEQTDLAIAIMDQDGRVIENAATTTIYHQFTQIVHGLVCLSRMFNVMVVNVFTTEYLKLPPSHSTLNLDPNLVGSSTPYYLFGFDCVGDLFKVLNVVKIKNNNTGINTSQFQVFTIKVDRSWRPINPPCFEISSDFLYHGHGSSVCVRGLVYWIQPLKQNSTEQFIDHFNVIFETFGRTPFPLRELDESCYLIGDNERLALVQKTIILDGVGNFRIKIWNMEGGIWTTGSIVLTGLQGFHSPSIIGTLLTGEYLIMDTVLSHQTRIIFYDMMTQTIKRYVPMTDLFVRDNEVSMTTWLRLSYNTFEEVGEQYSYIIRLNITNEVEHVFPLK